MSDSNKKEWRVKQEEEEFRREEAGRRKTLSELTRDEERLRADILRRQEEARLEEEVNNPTVGRGIGSTGDTNHGGTQEMGLPHPEPPHPQPGPTGLPPNPFQHLVPRLPTQNTIGILSPTS